MSEAVVYNDDLSMDKVIQIIGNEMVIFNDNLELEKIIQLRDD